MRVCLIAEKPSLCPIVLPFIRAMHPDLDEDAYACAYVHPYTHLNPDFILPRGLRWKEYPFTGEPAYRDITLSNVGRDGRRYYRVGFVPRLEDSHATGVPRTMTRFATPDPVFEDPQAEACRRMRGAHVIYAAVDTHDSSWHALDRMLSLLALDPAVEVRIPYLRSYAESDLGALFRRPHAPGDHHYREQVRRSRVARRFDYGYRANALAVMGRTMALAGAAPGAEVPSKYGLQTLYMLREAGPCSEQRAVDAMRRWRGTGKYAGMLREGYEIRGMGSPASRSSILEDLKVAGILELDGRQLRLSRLGDRFLDMVHPDCEDPDLPFRIEGWKLIPDEAEANARVDRYLRTFWGKQIRRLGRANSSGGVRELPGMVALS